ncbi:MAG TPA: acyl-CoA dehydrogenase family protein [Methylocella sp.]|nr:acyl-CoA dehydrogenase family protein [Methylocella sp.]
MNATTGGFEAASFNQTPPFENIDLFTSDAALQEAVWRAGIDAKRAGLSDFGRDFGSAETIELGRLANVNPPRLIVVDAVGNRADYVEFHPSYHALMKKSMAAGLHCPALGAKADTQDFVSERAARLYMATQIEAGHICPITMTSASAAALSASTELFSAWRPHLLSCHYDGAMKPWFEKEAVTLGMGMTERQGGSDVRANITRARSCGVFYEISGHKWFLSAPMSDGFVILAQADDGLTAFLVPRYRPDGSINGLRFQRLKDKLGNRSNASSEVEFQAAYAERLGNEGDGVRTILAMVQWTRLDCAVASAGQMRWALAMAMHHARHRSAFGKLLIDQPAMRAVLADLALEQEANTALVFRLARACGRASGEEAEAAYARLLTPVVKYLVTKIAPAFIYEALECLGGNGYVEDLPMARLYREAPLNAIWEGSGTVVALDVLRVLRRDQDRARAVIEALAGRCGAPGKTAAAAIGKTLEVGDGGEGRARAVAETLARLAGLSALMDANQPLAAAYARTRLLGAPHATFGACDLQDVECLLLARVPS